MLNAYDYHKQEWVEGEAAKTLLLSQIDQELALLRSPDGLQYWEFIKPRGVTESYRQYIKRLEDDRADILAGVYDETSAA